MAYHYQPGIIKNLSDFWKLKGDALPNILDETITPVFDVLPPANYTIEISAVNATTGTSTTNANFEHYLYGAVLTVIKDVTATSTLSTVTAVVDGRTFHILEIASLTLTPQENTVSVNFYPPVKIDTNSLVSVTNTTNVGNVTSRAILHTRRM